MREEGGEGGKGAFGGMVFKLRRSRGEYVLDFTAQFCKMQNVNKLSKNTVNLERVICGVFMWLLKYQTQNPNHNNHI